MKIKLIYIPILTIFLTRLSFSANPPWSVSDTAEGVWKTLNYTTGQPETIVKLWVEHDTLFGMITEVIDKKNGYDPVCTSCKDSLRNIPLKGLKIIWGGIKKDKRWVRGRILDITDGKIYRCEIDMSETGDLRVFAYVNRIFKVGRTYRWVRIY